MKNPFASLFKTQKKSIPQKVKEALELNFPGAINIDWDKKNSGYEAIFYLDEIEHISFFSAEGILLECKKNLWQNQLPPNIISSCHNQGEIMNAISIKRGNDLFFEVIIRDKDLNRTLLLFDQNCVQLKSEKI